MSHTLLYAVAGAAVILSYWLPRLFTAREPVASPLLIGAGVLVGFAVPGVSEAIDPVRNPSLWEYVAEFAVIIALFGTGLRIDEIADRRRWAPAIRLLVIAMPVTIVALAMAGLVAAGLTLAAAILLGGAMAPTDPVLAGGVQVGGPMQGKEEPVRFALTTEAGLNDGLAFPFIHLGILVALSSGISGDLLLTWAGKYVLYKIVAGALGGAATGWLVSRFLFLWPRRNPLSRTEAGVVAIAAVLFAYGVTELVQGYGFIAAFVAGLVVRRTEHRHEFNNTLHSFTETMEQSLTAFVLLALGAAIPVLWPWLDWRAMTLAALLVLVIRPGAGLLAMAGSRFTRRQRLVMSFYGIRGVGSIYYLAYAAGKAEFDDVGVLWATMTAAIIFSTVVHGLTATYAVESVEENPMPEKPPQPTVP